MPTISQELRTTGTRSADPTPALEKRRKKAEERKQLPSRQITPVEQRCCPACGGDTLGRKNFLFVGHDSAGENLAGLHSLVATCEANGINPEDYLADVLIRVKIHPNSRIREFLPPQWKRLRETAPPFQH